MQEVSEVRDIARERISGIVEKLIEGNSLYHVKLDREEMLKMLVSLFGKFSHEEFNAISDNHLIERIDSILILEAVSGTLNDLTPEQIEIFDAAVEGRERG